MGIFSSGIKHKDRGKYYESLAKNEQLIQRDIDFGRELLANIRQERIARSELEFYNTSDDFVSSSQMGAIGNIESSLADTVGYAYDTSKRAERIQRYMSQAQQAYKKYAKQQKRRGQAIQMTAIAAGVLTGGALGALGGVGGAAAGTVKAAIAGASIGSSVGSAAGSFYLGDWQGGLTSLASAAVGYANVGGFASTAKTTVDTTKTFGETVALAKQAKQASQFQQAFNNVSNVPGFWD